MNAPRTCTGCALKPVARKQLVFCFDCLPGGPHVPPPCRRCGAVDNYFSAGLCGDCHQFAPQPPGSCRECHAWGVRRIRGRLCFACIGWRQHYPTIDACRSCSHRHHVGRGGVCRLCWRQASDAREATKRQRPYPPIDVIAANRHGQQLFFADMSLRRHPRRTRVTGVVKPRRRRPPKQLSLFDEPPDTWAHRHGVPEPAKTARSNALEALVRDHATRHGWSRSTVLRTRLAVRVLASRQTNPDGRFLASDVMALQQDLELTAQPVLAVLADADLLDDDRMPAITTWFERQLDGLPAPMVDELRVWFDVQYRGSTSPPRSRPRAPVTIRVRVNWAMPILRAWAADGRTSLREISRPDVIAALPPSGNPRATAGLALRSLFRTLRARKLVFLNPIAGVTIGSVERREPLPMDVDTLRSLLDSTDTACAAVASLLVFHGLSSNELRQLQLTDMRDGRLRVADRTIRLATPARLRLRRWLDHRAAPGRPASTRISSSTRAPPADSNRPDACGWHEPSASLPALCAPTASSTRSSPPTAT